MKKTKICIGYQKRERIGVCAVCLLLFILALFLTGTVSVSAKSCSPGTTVANQCLFEGGACEHDGKIYYAVCGELRSVEKDGTNQKTLYTSCYGLMDLTVLGDYIYALEQPGAMAPFGRLIRVKMDGTGCKVYKGKKFDELEYLCAVGKKLYYEKNCCIYVMKPDDSGRKRLIKNARVCLVDGNYIYYESTSYNSNYTIKRCGMDGKKSRTVLSSKHHIWDFFIHDGYYYYSIQKKDVGTVYKKNIKSGSVKKLFSDKNKDYMPLSNLHASGKYLYFVNDKRQLMKVSVRTGSKSKGSKPKTISKVVVIRGTFDDVILVEKNKNKKPDRGTIVMLVNRRTGKKIVELAELFYIGGGG